MLVNALEPEESRIAVVDGGKLVEYYVERTSLGSQLGNIYKGRVLNVEPSIGAAFVEFGGPRHGFLSVQDVLPPEGAASPPDASEMEDIRDGSQRRPYARRGMRAIGELLRRGQEIIVQVIKDGIGNKGPTLTSYLSIPGRHLVLMPGVHKRGVSRKIQDPAERDRLKRLLGEVEVPDELGLIARTAGVGTTLNQLKRDLRYLVNLWKLVQRRARTSPPGTLLYQESDLVIRTLRDIYVPTEIDEVIFDSEAVLKRADDFLKVVAPRQGHRVKLHEGSKPLFHAYGVEKELSNLFSNRIDLPSGGYLIIEQTEAIVSIDVNSGRFREEGDLEETAFKTNIEAAREIARQLRLRDLGGVIINDFIDMREAHHRREVERMLREALRADRARIKLARMSPFGVIEMTRQRLRPSLKRTSFERCPYCNGTGAVAKAETVSLAVLRDIRLRLSESGDTVEILVSPEIADILVNRRRRTLVELEESSQKAILVRGEAGRRPEDFRIVVRTGTGAAFGQPAPGQAARGQPAPRRRGPGAR
ncbi:MAG: Rne/Rng family ribonuclease [Planctomycetota bacterium]